MYLGCLPTKLVVYIPQMLQKFCICQGHLPRHLTCSYQVFHTSLGCVLHFHITRICTTFAHVAGILYQIFSHQFRCAHPADAPEIPHFSGTSIRTCIYPDTRCCRTLSLSGTRLFLSFLSSTMSLSKGSGT